MRKLKITELNRISVEEFKEAEKLPLVVVLDNIRSLHNIGSVFRTSDAFRIECIYLCGITAPVRPASHYLLPALQNKRCIPRILGYQQLQQSYQHISNLR